MDQSQDEKANRNLDEECLDSELKLRYQVLFEVILDLVGIQALYVPTTTIHYLETEDNCPKNGDCLIKTNEPFFSPRVGDQNYERELPVLRLWYNYPSRPHSSIFGPRVAGVLELQRPTASQSNMQGLLDLYFADIRKALCWHQSLVSENKKLVRYFANERHS